MLWLRQGGVESLARLWMCIVSSAEGVSAVISVCL